MKIPEALDALAARLATIDGLTVTTDPGAKITPPMALVTDGIIEYDSTFGRGLDQLEVIVMVYVSVADSAEGAFEVREYKSGHGELSISQALRTPVVGDVFPTVTTNAESAVTTIDERPSGERYLTLRVSTIVQIPGKES